jgi:hypothetical protein
MRRKAANKEREIFDHIILQHGCGSGMQVPDEVKPV